MEPDLQNSDGRDIFCLRKGAELYLYFITREYKNRNELFLACPDGEGKMYDTWIYDAWNCRQAGRKTVAAGYHRDFELPDWAVLKMVQKR